MGFAGCLAVAAWLTGPLAAQEPAAGVGPALDRCSLRWRPLEANTRSVTNRDAAGAHVTVLSGRYLWTCGNATMEADSAIKRDGPRQVELLGAVVYEDSIRTLQSERLLYFQLSDFIIAEEDVELVRLTDRSTLSGPRVEFLRAVSGIDAVTTAPGGPTVTFYPTNTESPEPFVIESETAVFAGEDEARFYGDAVIERSDLNARADSAMLTRTDGLGVLWGEPWIEAEGVRLEGDSIRFVSRNQELEEIHAVGDGYASGERFEVEAELIDIDLANRQVEQLQAHGEGVSRALSGNHELRGDSIHFVMYGSQIDTAYAVGEAVAVQRDSSWAVPPDPEPAAADSTAADSTAADSTAANLTPADSTASDATAAVSDTTAAAAQDTAGAAVPDTTAAAARDTAGAAVPDTAAAAARDTSGAAVPDTTAASAQDTAGAAVPDSAAAAAEDTAGAAVPDSAAGSADTTEVETEDDEPAEIEMATDGSENWARGDTLIAVFERSAAPAADSGAAPDPFMRQLVLEGNASAFYRMVRDSTASARPSLNYLVARRIQVDFEGGEPAGVEGEHAIGAYLEPREAFGTPSPADSAAAADSAALADSAAVADSADSAAAAGDSLGAPPDTSDVRPDSTTAPPDTVGAPPDTVSGRGRPPGRDVPLALSAHQPGREGRLTSGAFPVLRPRRSC